MNRRHFLKQFGQGSLLVGSGAFPIDALYAHQIVDKSSITHITILHTNDVHSRIDPFPMDGTKTQGLGGAARRASLIQQIRKQNANVLLFDAGDIFQGTPFFNFYGGELEMKLMSEMGYDAAAIGNHDFDAGMDGLLKQLPHAKFPLLNINYDFTNTILRNKVQPYKIFQKEGIKIGVFGVGIELQGLVAEQNFAGTQYRDPLIPATQTATFLKEEMKCDYVVCLSHLGYKFNDNKSKICDIYLAEKSKNIDLIIGGHTHTFMDKPDIRKNIADAPVVINQVGWAGLMLGRLDIYFEKSRAAQCADCKNIYIGK
ncbi:MAG: hypothetical protein RL329_1769 [Bacteroidota bacterium]|jgi:5'-nucleotidase